mmetsp:Transcript_38033/g.109383  ORF Transcript_38033/g.109383 Transcript_38033/m.109383 type:complete len:1001 (+) Transcript_38033:176-3178(+)
MARVLVVSNRLPVTIFPDREPGDGDISNSSGGLVSALRSVVNDYEQVVWIGWPGAFIAEESEQRRWEARLHEESTSIKMVPVWISKEDEEEFYNGFANASLWPLLHWMIPYARFKKAWAEGYRRVNQHFADVILRVNRPGDLIMIHDYHLFLLPILLRKAHGELDDSQASPSRSPRQTDRVVRPKDLPPQEEGEDLMSRDDTGERSSDRRPSHLPSSSSCGVEDMEQRSRFASLDMEQQQTDSSPKGVRFNQLTSTHAFESDKFLRADSLPSKLRIVFFLHTPFPSFEIISTLPNCSEIVEGVLGADLVGFHTYNYLRHYRSCVIRMCGVHPEIDHVLHNGMRTKLGVFPIGANWQSIAEAMTTDRFSEHLRNYTQQFQGKSLVLSVERLDYSKGMPQKLAAIERYLERSQRSKKRQNADEQADEHEREREERLKDLQERFQERRGGDAASNNMGFKVRTSLRRLVRNFNFTNFTGQEEEPLDHTRTIFLFIAVPSRQDVEEYRNIEEEVHRTISMINGRFSTIDHQPIVYIHRGVSIDELAALYARADCCLVTPLVDGMNLVAKEFVAAKDKAVENVVPGTIVLSEAAGAAQELFDALVVNPYDEDAVADAIHVGLELTKGTVLDEESRWEVTGRMRKAVMQNDAQTWAAKLLSELQKCVGEPSNSSAYPCGQKQIGILPDFTARFFFDTAPGTKAIFFDFDGRILKEDHEESDGQPPPLFDEEDHELFAGLEARQDLHVFIVSGSTKDCLESCFGQYESFSLVAENGFFLRKPGASQKWRPFCPQSSIDWMAKVLPVIELFTRCTPGSKYEKKATSIIWDYSGCDDEYGTFKAKELMHLLALSLGNLPCQTMESSDSCLVEVKSLQVKKGLAVRMLCLLQEEAQEQFAEVLCIGDDDADESMFIDAPQSAYTVKVGLGSTSAYHRLPDVARLRHFLSILVKGKAGLGTTSIINGDSIAVFKSIDERAYTVNAVAEADDSEGDPLAFLQNEEQESAEHR